MIKLIIIILTGRAELIFGFDGAQPDQGGILYSVIDKIAGSRDDCKQDTFIEGTVITER